MKKYRYSFPKSIFFIYALIVVAAIVAIVFASLRLAEVGNYISIYPAVDIASIVVFAIFLVLLGWHLFGSYYLLEGRTFTVVQLFSKKKVDRDAIAKLVIDEESGLAALYFIDPATPDVLSFVTINLKRKVLDAFSEDLRLFKTDIVIEINPVQKEEK